MPELDLNIINNVFVSVGGNKLRLAKIYFDSTIKSIQFLSEPFDWEDIETLEKRNAFLSRSKFDNNINSNSVDGQFNLLMPGAIDSHVHFNTPGFEQREDFQHASNAAAFGGVTTIVDMPCTSIPPVTSVSNLKTKLETLKGKSVIDYALWGGISRNDLGNNTAVHKNITELSEAGVVGFKAYLISGMKTFKDLNNDQMKIVAQYVKDTGKLLGVHAEDKFLVESRRLRFQETNRNTWRQYCLSRDVLAEEKAVKEMIDIASTTGVKTHIVHLSSKIALDLIRNAQNKGIPISSETCPHYLYFTQDNFLNPEISNFLKTAPPVKFEEDKLALWNGLADGTLSFVVSDHAGSIPEIDKSSENFWEVYGGIPGVEHRVPFLFSEGFIKNKVTLEQTINLLSTNTANHFGIKNKGSLQLGYDADFALINLWDKEIISAKNMHSKGWHTPFEGEIFNATVEKTWLRGNIIADRSNEIKTFYEGNFIPVN